MLFVAAAGMLLASGLVKLAHAHCVPEFQRASMQEPLARICHHEVGYAGGDVFENGWCKWVVDCGESV